MSRRKPWDQLSPGYRSGLERKGITRQSHAAGVPLYAARRHGSRELEQQRRFQTSQLATYGPRDAEGTLLITKEDMRAARATFGDQWVTARIQDLVAYGKLHAQGQSPFKYARDRKRYGRKADEKLNRFAMFFWYHGGGAG